MVVNGEIESDVERVKCGICGLEFDVVENRGLGRTVCFDCILKSKDIRVFSEFVNNMEVENMNRTMCLYLDFAINDRVSDYNNRKRMSSKWKEVVREIDILRKARKVVDSVVGCE